VRELGHAPVTAEDGVKAVEAAGRERFDLILMDLHMPGMDGFMAARAIRAGGGPNVATPIVALSADVLPETVAACREAGMAGHLAKPIDRQRLRELLGRLGTLPAPPSGPSAVAEAAEALDREVLDELARSVGPQTMATLRDAMRTDAGAALAAIAAATTAGDVGAIGRQAHRLVGVTASFGGTAMAVRARALEAAAKAGDLALCAEGCRGLEAELSRFLALVEASGMGSARP
jgi:CheY-like chemotaxis protein